MKSTLTMSIYKDIQHQSLGYEMYDLWGDLAEESPFFISARHDKTTKKSFVANLHALISR